jgi:hypothetical protein
MTDLLDLLVALLAGFRPGPAELAQAPVVEGWEIVPTVGAFLLSRGAPGEGAPVLLALDAEAGWALVTDSWLRLGPGRGSLAPNDEIMRRAMAWLAEDEAPENGRAEARIIAAAAALLARRAERAGLPAAPYFLDAAAGEASGQGA